MESVLALFDRDYLKKAIWIFKLVLGKHSFWIELRNSPVFILQVVAVAPEPANPSITSSLTKICKCNTFYNKNQRKCFFRGGPYYCGGRVYCSAKNKVCNFCCKVGHFQKVKVS